jgi:hypothetical protein
VAAFRKQRPGALGKRIGGWHHESMMLSRMRCAEHSGSCSSKSASGMRRALAREAEGWRSTSTSRRMTRRRCAAASGSGQVTQSLISEVQLPSIWRSCDCDPGGCLRGPFSPVKRALHCLQGLLPPSAVACLTLLHPHCLFFAIDPRCCPFRVRSRAAVAEFRRDSHSPSFRSRAGAAFISRH